MAERDDYAEDHDLPWLHRPEVVPGLVMFGKVVLVVLLLLAVVSLSARPS